MVDIRATPLTLRLGVYAVLKELQRTPAGPVPDGPRQTPVRRMPVQITIMILELLIGLPPHYLKRLEKVRRSDHLLARLLSYLIRLG